MVERFDRFDEILDDCISRITFRGETVESCLARYQEHARDLEPYLRTAARVSQAYSFAPSHEAKERARQRLHAERSALARRASRESKGLRSWHWWNFRWMPRWAVASVAAFLLVVAGGVGTVSASSNTLPGEALYPVKRSAEQIWLSMQFSPEGKAKLSLQYAQRRTDEMVALVKEGKVQQLATLRSDLLQNLQAASNAIGSVSEGADKTGLSNQLQDSAVQSLNALQAAAQQAPEASRQAATDTFQASSQAFGTAVETVAAQAPSPVVTAAAAPGILQVLASDPPPPNVDKVLVTVSQIQVYLSAGDNSHWITVSQDPQTFDLMRVADIQKFLAQKEVPPGTYTRVSFLITSASVVVGGVERPAQVPDQSLSLQRPFIVEQGKTTSVSLDFDGARSLQIVGQNKFIMAPVVNVLVHRARGEEERRQTKGQQQQPQVSQPAAGRLSRAEFEGRVDSVSAGQIVVRGVNIKLAPTTAIQGTITQGQKADIEAIVQPDGSFLAVKVEVSSAGNGGESGPRGPESRSIQLTGAVQSISPNEWTVNGQKVTLTAKTELNGQAVVGSMVKVEGTVQADGSILAKQISVVGGGKASEGKQEQGNQEVDLVGTITQVGVTGLTLDGRHIIITLDTKVQGVLAAGVRADVKGQQQPDGSVIASSIQVLSKSGEAGNGSDQKAKPPEGKGGEGQSPATSANVTGTIKTIGLTQWMVDGATVVVSADTRIDGTPAVGLMAQIVGQQQPDGTILASSIRVLSTPDSGQNPDQKSKPPDHGTPGQGSQGQGAPPGSVTFSGTIQKISLAQPGQTVQWTVDGTIVIVNADTRIDGVPALGVKALVTGQQQPDGKILAASIKVQAKADTTPNTKDPRSNSGRGEDNQSGQKDSTDNSRSALPGTANGPTSSTWFTPDSQSPIVGMLTGLHPYQ